MIQGRIDLDKYRGINFIAKEKEMEKGYTHTAVVQELKIKVNLGSIFKMLKIDSENLYNFDSDNLDELVFQRTYKVYKK